MNRRSAILTCVVAMLVTCNAAPGQTGSVYSNVFSKLSAAENRLPGTPAYIHAVGTIAGALRDAGLRPRLQTFDTVVPTVERCTLTVDGRTVGSSAVVQNGISPLVTDGAVTGRVVFAADGRLESLRGLRLDDAVAVIDLDMPRVTLANVFSLGARAAILTGSDRMDAWNVASVCEEGPVALPVVFVPRAEAVRFGLLAPLPGSVASLNVQSTVSDAMGVNLWVFLPAESNSVFRLGTEEIVILSAHLDTAGVIPAISPQKRDTANAALLADVLCRLAERPRKRSIIGVFFGAQYSAQEGARNFYFAVSRSERYRIEGQTLEDRHTAYREELGLADRMLAVCDTPDVLAADGRDADEFRIRLRQNLGATVNNLNAELRLLRIEADQLRKAGQPASGSRLADLDAAIAARTQIKSRWNSLRNHVSRRNRDLPQADREDLSRVLDSMRATLGTRKAELDRSIRNNTCSIAIAEHIGPRNIVGHFHFDFSDPSGPWMFSMMNSCDLFVPITVTPGSYLLHLSELGKIWNSLPGEYRSPPLFTEALNPWYKPFSLSVPGQRSAPTAVPILLGLAGFQLMTVGDPLQHDGLPLSTGNDLSPFIAPMTALAATVANDPGMSLRPPFQRSPDEKRLVYTYEGGTRYTGLQCINYAKTSSDVEGPASGALLVAAPTRNPVRLPGVTRAAIARVNTDGYVFMPMMNAQSLRRADNPLFAFGHDDRGRLNRVSVVPRTGFVIDQPLCPLFYAYGGACWSYGFAPDLSGAELYNARTLDARNDSVPQKSFSGKLAGLTAYYTDRPGAMKRIGSRGELLLGADAQHPFGAGIPLNEGSLLRLDGVARSAEDYWSINEHRFLALRTRGLAQDSLEMLHASARDHLEQARNARTQNDHSAARAHAIISTCISNRIYNPLRGVTDDMVKAVIFLLLLNIPFSFAMERLLFCSTSIYRQVLGFVGCFAITFLLLFFTHPAFALASAPLVIFLAFVIILLGAVTLAILMGKIRQEIRVIQGLASTVHSAQNDSSTAMSAVLIGLSGMRKRPMKTFLTVVTIVLLTFTILAFASFTAQIGVVEAFAGKGHGGDRIELHRFSYLEIPDDFVEMLETAYGGKYRVVRRNGIFMNPTRPAEQDVMPQVADRVLYHPERRTTAGIGALVGIDPAETAVLPDLRAALPDFTTTNLAAAPIYLSKAVAERLDVKPGETILMNGRRFVFAGIADQSALSRMRTLDNTSILPPDFAATAANMGRSRHSRVGVQELEEIDSGMFEWFSSDQVAFTSTRALEEMFQSPNTFSVVLYPRTPDVSVTKTARELARIFQGSVHVQSGQTINKSFLTTVVAGSGLADVVVPLILGGLIIFSSLMGSIADREREIFTYSALGLSPVSVGALFFAESAVYSVVGGMGGYLLGQVVMRGITALASVGVVVPLEMNFSSLSSVTTIFLVMSVVMLSTIYPAVKASRSANPGVARTWKMPAPAGNRLDFIFPFTVSKTDFGGILGFMSEHFINHSDATLGSFAAKNVRLFHEEANGKQRIGIAAEVSLAPFDLGVFQKFRMYARELDIPGIEEVVVEIERIAGSPGAWIRGNRTFAADLRRQFLLWRSLPIATIEHYRRITGDTPGNPDTPEKTT